MSNYSQKILQKLISAEQCPKRLTLSCCAGVFLACAPFLGIQTLLAIIFGMLMRLNTKVIVIVLFLINNPFTMIPIVIADCLTGAFLIERALGISIDSYLPEWLSSIDKVVTQKLSCIVPAGVFTFGTYLVGGLIFAFICSIPLYPILYPLFKKLLKKYIPEVQNPEDRTNSL